MLEIPTRCVYIHMIDTARAAVGSRDVEAHEVSRQVCDSYYSTKSTSLS